MPNKAYVLLEEHSMKTIKFKYKFRDDYNPVYVNGAYGGITPKGEIIANFFLERHAIPKKETLNIEEDNDTKRVEFEPGDLHDSLVRYVETGIVMNVDTAREIITWLQDKLQMIDDLNKIPFKGNNNVSKKQKKSSK